MDDELSIRDISMNFDDDDTIIRTVSDDGDDAVLTRLPSHQWKEIIDFLTVEDFKALRLTGSKVSWRIAGVCTCLVFIVLFYVLVHMLCSQF